MTKNQLQKKLLHLGFKGRIARGYEFGLSDRWAWVDYSDDRGIWEPKRGYNTLTQMLQAFTEAWNYSSQL